MRPRSLRLFRRASLFPELRRRLQENKTLSHAVSASGGKTFVFAASFVRNLLLARLIGPLELGIWSFGLVLLQYAQWSHFTILSAFRLELPRKRGAGLVEEIPDLRRLTWTSTTFPALLVVAGALGAVFLVENTALKWSVLILAAVLLPQQWYLYVTSSLSADGHFPALARLQIAYALVSVFLTVFMAWQWGLRGALVAQVLSYGAVLALFSRKVPLLMRPLFRKELLLEQFWIGLPVGINGIIYTFFVTIDRTLVASLAGVVALGHYSLTVFVRSSLGLLPDAISEVMYVHTSARVGAKESIASIQSMIRRADVLIAWGAAALIGPAVIWVGWFVRIFLPAYATGIVAVRIFIVGMFFTFPTYTGVLLTSLGRATTLMKYYVVATIVQAVLVTVFLPAAGISGAAVATFCSGALLFFMINLLGPRASGANAGWSHVARCLVPWFGMIGGVAAALIALPGFDATASLARHLSATSLYLIVFGVVTFLAVKVPASGLMRRL